MARKKKQNLTKVIWFASAGFVALMLTLSVVLFMVDDSTPRAEAQNTVSADTIPLTELDLSDSIDEPLSAIDPDDEFMLDSAMLEDVGDLQNQQVPEPATLSMLGLGGIALLKRRRRNRKN